MTRLMPKHVAAVWNSGPTRGIVSDSVVVFVVRKGGQRQRMALARALAVEPAVLLLDEPLGALDAKVRRELRDWLRRLHDDVHVTTVFVTHDREGALEVADEIVLINHGRVEQVGTPAELYDRPANDFVMEFPGPVTTFGGKLVRPPDLEILTHPQTAAIPAKVVRVQHFGFAVRAGLRTPFGEEPWVHLTRGQADALGLVPGASRWIRRISRPALEHDRQTPPVRASERVP